MLRFEYIGYKVPENGDWFFRNNNDIVRWKWDEPCVCKQHCYRATEMNIRIREKPCTGKSKEA